jgi:hypothetical protein
MICLRHGRTWRALALAALAVLGGAELALRLSGTYKTYSERTVGVYRTYYGQTLPTWFHLVTAQVAAPKRAAT